MKSALYNKIISRGYWQVIIHPTSFKEKRVDDIAALFPIVEKAQVKLRGWYFPDIDPKTSPSIDIDWIGHESEWEDQKSIWRLYQSGLFFHLNALSIDWRDESHFWPADANWKPNTKLGIGDTVATLTEIFEFAARLSLSDAGDNSLHIEIQVSNLQNRSLYVDSSKRLPLRVGYQTTMTKFPYTIDVDRSQLLSEAKNLALLVANELFKRFGFNVGIEALSSWQDELRI